uniref:Putative ovule protein n=1 Tax=Solanum chacoense TaxID=4108 RepID=A0A0V0GMJ3_SOLCH
MFISHIHELIHNSSKKRLNNIVVLKYINSVDIFYIFNIYIMTRIDLFRVGYLYLCGNELEHCILCDNVYVDFVIFHR